MKAALTLVTLMLASPVLAASPEESRRAAAMIEWAVANCEKGGISALQVNMWAMVINGTGPEEFERYRRKVREGVKVRYPDTAAACADFLAHIKQAQ